MMDKKLQEINKHARNTCKIPLKIGDIWQSGDCLQVFFSSTGCRFRDAGYCTMCDYGGFRNLSAEAKHPFRRFCWEHAGASWMIERCHGLF